jgi:hypothetical protein
MSDWSLTDNRSFIGYGKLCKMLGLLFPSSEPLKRSLSQIFRKVLQIWACNITGSARDLEI